MLNRDTIIDIRERHEHKKRDVGTIVSENMSFFDKTLSKIVVFATGFIPFSIRFTIIVALFETFVYSFELFTPFKTIMWVGFLFLFAVLTFLSILYLEHKAEKIAKKLNLHVDLYK